MKTQRELVYKKGLAVVINGIEENASEYDSGRDYKVTLYFSTKTAIGKVAKIVGYKLDKKRTLEGYEKGNKKVNLYLDSQSFWILQREFEFKYHIGRGGYSFYYMNHYSDNSLNERVNPGEPFKNISEYTLDTYLGSCAGGNGTFKEHIQYVLDGIEKGEIYYCPYL